MISQAAILSEGNYRGIFLDGPERVVRESRKEIAQKLRNGALRQSHSSYLVNSDKITKIRRNTKRGHDLYLSRKIPLSPCFVKPFEGYLDDYQDLEN